MVGGELQHRRRHLLVGEDVLERERDEEREVEEGVALWPQRARRASSVRRRAINARLATITSQACHHVAGVPSCRRRAIISQACHQCRARNHQGGAIRVRRRAIRRSWGACEPRCGSDGEQGCGSGSRSRSGSGSGSGSGDRVIGFGFGPRVAVTMVKKPPARDLPGPPEIGGMSAERSTDSASLGCESAIRVVIKWQSSGNRVVIKWQSGGNQVAIRWQSCPTRRASASRARSSGNQVVIEWQSSGNRVAIKLQSCPQPTCESAATESAVRKTRKSPNPSPVMISCTRCTSAFVCDACNRVGIGWASGGNQVALG